MKRRSGAIAGDGAGAGASASAAAPKPPQKRGRGGGSEGGGSGGGGSGGGGGGSGNGAASAAAAKAGEPPIAHSHAHDPVAFECPCDAAEYDCGKRMAVRSACACNRLLCRKCAGVVTSLPAPAPCGLCGAAAAPGRGPKDSAFKRDLGVLAVLLDDISAPVEGYVGSCRWASVVEHFCLFVRCPVRRRTVGGVYFFSQSGSSGSVVLVHTILQAFPGTLSQESAGPTHNLDA
jgi:hypothetical protein